MIDYNKLEPIAEHLLSSGSADVSNLTIPELKFFKSQLQEHHLLKMQFFWIKMNNVNRLFVSYTITKKGLKQADKWYAHADGKTIQLKDIPKQ